MAGHWHESRQLVFFAGSCTEFRSLWSLETSRETVVERKPGTEGKDGEAARDSQASTQRASRREASESNTPLPDGLSFTTVSCGPCVKIRECAPTAEEMEEAGIIGIHVWRRRENRVRRVRRELRAAGGELSDSMTDSMVVLGQGRGQNRSVNVRGMNLGIKIGMETAREAKVRGRLAVAFSLVCMIPIITDPLPANKTGRRYYSNDFSRRIRQAIGASAVIGYLV
ncbi:hypothetical protein Bbelb_344210 [Branchiostoma belcheri]|nr:hypothetical protein Bbelb_344210 [Branchiostoma belcheri]